MNKEAERRADSLRRATKYRESIRITLSVALRNLKRAEDGLHYAEYIFKIAGDDWSEEEGEAFDIVLGPIYTAYDRVLNLMEEVEGIEDEKINADSPGGPQRAE